MNRKKVRVSKRAMSDLKAKLDTPMAEITKKSKAGAFIDENKSLVCPFYFPPSILYIGGGPSAVLHCDPVMESRKHFLSSMSTDSVPNPLDGL